METTYRSEYGALLPARIYGVTQGQSRYSVTVVDSIRFNEYSRTKPRVILSLQSERIDRGGD